MLLTDRLVFGPNCEPLSVPPYYFFLAAGIVVQTPLLFFILREPASISRLATTLPHSDPLAGTTCMLHSLKENLCM